MCNIHGALDLLYASDVTIFQELLDNQNDLYTMKNTEYNSPCVTPTHKSQLNVDLDRTLSLLQYPKGSINHPLIITYNPYTSNGKLKDIEELHDDVLKMRIIYNIGEKFIIKLLAVHHRPDEIISILKNIKKLIPGQYIWIKLSSSDLHNYNIDIFKQQLVCVNTTIYIQKGGEKSTLLQLNDLLDFLKNNDLSIILTVYVFIPYPNLTVYLYIYNRKY